MKLTHVPGHSVAEVNLKGLWSKMSADAAVAAAAERQM